jgi:hypothetical protein
VEILVEIRGRVAAEPRRAILDHRFGMRDAALES